MQEPGAGGQEPKPGGPGEEANYPGEEFVGQEQEPKPDRYRIEIRVYRYPSDQPLTLSNQRLEANRSALRGADREETYRIADALMEHAQAEKDWGERQK